MKNFTAVYDYGAVESFEAYYLDKTGDTVVIEQKHNSGFNKMTMYTNGDVLIEWKNANGSGSCELPSGMFYIMPVFCNIYQEFTKNGWGSITLFEGKPFVELFK